ncbi:uncharacterized protein LOC125178119 [Hyalella azteca]|uniref:Uncharacterized protein LOC125178119 n=1 Tax=Hyalella azteca TaxID=294128 RepID=A0A979FJG1_HYAAZ|nr:uncharacterized protein LOC125178119 [Hyalella azteca]
MEPIAAATVLAAISVFGTVVNSLVFCVFYRRPSLRSISNRFVLSLTSANLIATVLVGTIQGVRLAKRPWRMEASDGLCFDEGCLDEGRFDEGRFDEGRLVGGSVLTHLLCQGGRSLTTLAIQAAIFSVLIIAVDRVLPKIVRENVTREVFNKFGFYYTTFLAFSGLIAPFFVLCWIYIKMYQTAQKNSQRTRRHSLGANPQEFILPECPSTPESTTTNSVKGKTRVCRKRSANNSNVSLFFREEGRAVKTGVIVTVSYLVSWVPFYSYKIVETSLCHHPFVEDFVVILALSATCFLPFIYVYRNATARKEALKIVCWWKPIEIPTPALSRHSVHNRMSNGNLEVPLPVRIVEPDGTSLYSYAAECTECGANQLVSALKHYPPPSPCDQIGRVTGMPRRQSTVSFKLNPTDGPVARCRQCLRQDSASSASSDDPLLLERWRYPRPSMASVRWTKHRLSNGSVTTRSDSLASTNSSVISYGIARIPLRRYSAISTDTGDTILKKISAEDCTMADIAMRRYSCQRSLYSEGRDELSEIDESIEFHGYSNPFKHCNAFLHPNVISSSSLKWSAHDIFDSHLDCKINCNGHSSAPNIERLQLPLENGRPLKEHLCQVHPHPLISFKTLAEPEKMCINGSPEFAGKLSRKVLQRATSNPRFLRIPVVKTRNNGISTRLEKDGLAFTSDSNLNEGKRQVIKESRSAE